jgi:hypothetical protein
MFVLSLVAVSAAAQLSAGGPAPAPPADAVPAQSPGASSALVASPACPSKAAAEPDGMRLDTTVGAIWFCNSTDCDSGDCREFRLLGEERGRYTFVAVDFYEGSTVFAVDRIAGEVRSLNSPPRFNPSASIFATSRLDEMNGSSDTDGLFIWSFDDTGRIRQDWHLRTEELADAEIIGWSGDRCLNVRGFKGWGTSRHASVQPFFVQRHQDGAWRLAPGRCDLTGD